MTDVSFGALVVRMVVSLAIVLAVMFALVAVLRRRQGYVSSSAPRSSRRSRTPWSSATRSVGKPGVTPAGRSAGKTSGNRNGLRVLGRLGVGRNTSLVAVQFAERVLLVGSNDTGTPHVMAEVDLTTWEALIALEEEAEIVREAIVPGSTPRAGVLDALREATIRRA